MHDYDEPYEMAAEARKRAQEADAQIQRLKQDVERLLMITEALWLLLKKAHGYSDDELRNLITEIDMRDGVLDGRVKKQESLVCPVCNRPVSFRQPSCIYCGQPLQHDPFAR